MYNRLITFGCSFTYGECLPDNNTKEIPHLNNYPSIYAWPQILANKLGIECVNKGECAVSNKQIAYNILNFPFSNNDLVIVLWTFHTRHCVIYPNDILRIGPWNYKTPIKKDTAAAYYKYFDQEKDVIFTNYLYYNTCFNFLKNKNIKTLYLTVSNSTLHNLSWNEVSFVPLFFDTLKNDYHPALDDIHPGVEAHDFFANEIYNKYINI